MKSKHTTAGAALTGLILETFRLHGALIAAGNDLVGDLGLSSARWQVLGAVALAGEPLTVADVGRAMGLTRQAVQRVVNDLEAAGLVGFRANPAHSRAQLVALSDAGRTVYAEADRRQRAWVNGLGRGIGAADIEAAAALVRGVAERLEHD